MHPQICYFFTVFKELPSLDSTQSASTIIKSSSNSTIHSEERNSKLVFSVLRKWGKSKSKILTDYFGIPIKSLHDYKLILTKARRLGINTKPFEIQNIRIGEVRNIVNSNEEKVINSIYLLNKSKICEMACMDFEDKPAFHQVTASKAIMTIKLKVKELPPNSKLMSIFLFYNNKRKSILKEVNSGNVSNALKCTIKLAI